MEPEEIKKQDKKESIWETVKFAIIAIIIVIPIRMFIAQPFVVSGSSMYPTFHDKDYLIVDEISYKFKDIQRNDVIIFKYPENPSKFFIKRVIGLPNETVEVNGNVIKITDKNTNETKILEEPFLENNFGDKDAFLELGSDEYFVMGDNRNASSDSRYWGAVKKDLIIGQALLRLLPVNNIDYKPGDF
jgi:signal peptidase I